MSDILHQRLSPSDQVVETGVGDEIVLLHLTRGSYFGLDPVGTRIWSDLKSGFTPAQACERLVEAFNVTLDQAEADTRAFLTDLVENDIVECEPE